MVVTNLAGALEPELVWRNELDGLTFRLDDRFVKWQPWGRGIDLARERDRLRWISSRHPAPHVIGFGEDSEGQWLVTRALPGGHAVGDTWRERREEAIAAIAIGLRALHQIRTDGFPSEWVNQTWPARAPSSLGPAPPTEQLVLVHGDACAPNTLISADGHWTGHVDFGDLTVADRWADLAIASLSLDWNFGDGHQPEFFAAYGVDPDPERIDYYRRLWHLES